jgi:preprotein translocase subunit SecD
MTTARRSKIAHGLAIACRVASVAACWDGLGQVQTASPVAFFTMTSVVAVPSKDKPTINAAADILEARIRALGIGPFSVGIGDTMIFDMTVPETVDKASIDAVLSAHGSIAFLGLAPGAPDPVAGAPVPAGSQPIFDASTQITAATLGKDQNGQPVVYLALGSDGAKAFAAYTRAHTGDSFLIALDGVVVNTVTIMNAIESGPVELSFADTAPISAAAMAAIVASGPLPEAWTTD